MADMGTALNGGYSGHFSDMIPARLSDAYNKLSTPESLDKLQHGNMISQLIGAGIQGGQALANYDYPNDTLGWMALPAQAVTGLAKGAVDQIQGAMDEAPGAVMGLNDGSQNTNLVMGLLGTNAVMPFRAPAKSLSAHVWQGSPHKYGADGAAKSLEHIGKGEGAQAYGWGRYDAGAREVGEIYRKNLTADSTMKPLPGIVDKYQSQWDDILKELRPLNDAMSKPGVRYDELKLLSEKASPLQDKLDALHDQMLRETRDAVGSGHLYKHDLPDEDIARYLDWDKPLSEQPQGIADALAKLGIKQDPNIEKRMYEIVRQKEAMANDRMPNNRMRQEKEWFALADEYDRLSKEYSDPKGAEIYGMLEDRFGATGWPDNADSAMRAKYRSASRQKASEALAQAGIPGLKYLDGSSRRAGEGSHNYVTWDQDVLNRMKLLERNGESMTDALTGHK